MNIFNIEHHRVNNYHNPNVNKNQYIKSTLSSQKKIKDKDFYLSEFK